MCEADYTTALDALGANAAGLLRKFTISEPNRIASGSDCVMFGAAADEANIDCDGDGQFNGPNDAPMCVSAQCAGEDAPRLLTRGVEWVWEQTTSSVRFSGRCVPAPNTEVVVTYGLRATNDTSCGAGG